MNEFNFAGVRTLAGRIKLLGRPAIIDDAGESQSVRGHQAWALLARVLLSKRPVERQSLAVELFAEAVDPLGALRWCLAALRKALNASNCLVGDPIDLQLPADMTVDLWLLEQDQLPLEEMGTLLAGIDPQCSPEFATWLLVERERITALIDGKIRRATLRALALSNFEQAIPLAEFAVSRDSYNESAHILLVKALALAGRSNAAIAHIEATERLFSAELDAQPSLALRSAARLSVASRPQGISIDAHVRSLVRSGVAALAAGAPDAGIETLRQAVAQAEREDNTHLYAEATLELGKGLVHAVRGFDDEGAILLRQCAEIAQSRGYNDLAAEGYRELGYIEALAGRRPGADDYLRAALQFATDASLLAKVHSALAFNLVDWGRVELGMRHYGVALEHARSSGNRRSEVWSLGLGAWGLLAEGRLAEAEVWLARCLEHLDDLRWIAFRPWPVAVLGELKLRQQALPAGLRPALEEGFALGCQLQDPCWEAATARSLALTYAADRQFELAAQWLEEADRRCIRVSDPYVALRVEILAAKVDVSQHLGQEEAAATLSRELIGMAARAHMDLHVERAATYLLRKPQA